MQVNNKQKKSILILGASGFIGMELIDQLRSRTGEYNIIILGHKNIPYREFEPFNLYTGSLVDFDPEILIKNKPDFIFHFARLRGKGKAGRYIAAKRGEKANARIIRYIKGMSQKPRVFYAGGTLTYGDRQDIPVTESDRLNPTGYARQYYIAERPWVSACDSGVIPVTIFRPPWIVGQRSWFKNYFIEPMRKSGVVPVYGNGSNWMSIIDLTDCAGIMLHALLHSRPGSVYNIFNPEAVVLQTDFCSILSEVTGLPVRHYSKKEITGHYGRATWEALTFSLRSSTLHSELIKSYQFRYRSVKSIIIHNLPDTLKQ